MLVVLSKICWGFTACKSHRTLKDKDNQKDDTIATSGAEATESGPEQNQEPESTTTTKKAAAKTVTTKRTKETPEKEAAASGTSNIAGMFASIQVQGGAASGTGQQSSKVKKANKEINRSDTVANDAAQLIQLFDDPGSVSSIAVKKIEDAIEKVKGQVSKKYRDVMPSVSKPCLGSLR